jgi:hypothetical protein
MWEYVCFSDIIEFDEEELDNEFDEMDEDEIEEEHLETFYALRDDRNIKLHAFNAPGLHFLHVSR